MSLEVGKTYQVELEDCCLQVSVESTLVEIEINEYQEIYTFAGGTRVTCVPGALILGKNAKEI